MTDDEDKKRYLICPIYKKSSVEEQTWCNTLTSGKSVSIVAYNVFRWSNFFIDLTDSEYEDILELDSVKISDYDYEMIDMTDGGCDFGTDIVNEESFDEKEIEEIKALLEEESEDMAFYEKMESKGWVEEDCEYTITCKCELELVNE